jgi:hypothetical protein
VPKPYDCPGLAGIDFGAKLMDLSALEQQLELDRCPTGRRSSRPAGATAPAVNLRQSRLLKDLGGG